MNKPKVLSPKAFVGSSIKTSVKVLEEFAASVVDLASKNGEYLGEFTIAFAAGMWYNVRRQGQKGNMNTNLLLNGLLLLALTGRGACLLV